MGADCVKSARCRSSGIRPVSGTNAYLEDVQWLPDGKHVSFVYHGIL